jgi:ribosome-binding protein aMBF1 (putative translation factor)
MDLHPDDEAARHEHRDRIVRLRYDAGWSSGYLARHLGLVRETVTSFETYPSANSEISRYDRHAAPFGFRTYLETEGLDGYGETPYSAVMDAAGDIGAAEVARLHAYRLHAGLARLDVARLLGVHPSVLLKLEEHRSPPKLASVQRLARILGGRLAITLIPLEEEL